MVIGHDAATVRPTSRVLDFGRGKVKGWGTQAGSASWVSGSKAGAADIHEALGAVWGERKE